MSFLERIGKAALGAIGGFFIGGPVGAVVGGGIGFFSSEIGKGVKAVFGNPIGGALGGGLVGGLAGFALGGPIGALLGGTLGSTLGSTIGSYFQQKEQQKQLMQMMQGFNYGALGNYNMGMAGGFGAYPPMMGYGGGYGYGAGYGIPPNVSIALAYGQGAAAYASAAPGYGFLDARDIYNWNPTVDFGQRAVKRDPLVIDLDGDGKMGIDEAKRIQFDMNGDGINDTVHGWTTSDGFLAIDRNGDGKINNGTELFGPQSGDAWKELAALDGNNDGVLTGDELKNLQVWRDKNGDGVSGEGEIVKAQDLGLIGIVLGKDNQTGRFVIDPRRRNLVQ